MNKTSRNMRLSSAVRLAFPQLFEPKPVMLNGVPKGDPAFSARIVIPMENQALIQELAKLQQEIAAQAWPEGPPMQFRWAMNEGARMHPNDETVANAMVISARSRQESPPEVVCRDPSNPSRIIPLTDRTAVFSGMEAYVMVCFYSYQNSANDGGIACGLNAVMPTGRDVGRFDGRTSAKSGFADLPRDVGVIQPPTNLGGTPAQTASSVPGAPVPPGGAPANDTDIL